MTASISTNAIVFAGSPMSNLALYHQIRFAVGDPTALIVLPTGPNSSTAPHRLLMIRDIEMERAKQTAKADEVVRPIGLADRRPRARNRAVRRRVLGPEEHQIRHRRSHTSRDLRPLHHQSGHRD